MPRISEIFGIAIYMYWFDTNKHHKPHIHAIFNGKQAVFSLDHSNLAGSLGKRADRLVLEFIKERESELTEAWLLAIKGKELPWIKPIS